MPRSTSIAAAVLALAGSAVDAAPETPNIVVIFTDDQGYADVGVFGATTFPTPNLDRMAAEGMRFTDFYVAQPVCSASRAALLTGCYPNRIGISGALGPRSKVGLGDGEVTLGELCKSRGYATAAYGKWHLGVQPRFLPPRHGFDDSYGIPYSNDMWPWHPSVADLPDAAERRKKGYPDLPLIENGVVVVDEVKPEHQVAFTTQFTEHAVRFIDEHAKEPFFVYLAHPMPHVPLFASDKFEGKTAGGRYGDVIGEIDWSVGEVLRALERNGVDDKTLVIFTSDNGPWLSYGDHGGSTGPLREGKGTTFEGGVRVPCIMRWPGKIQAGSVCREPVMTIDVLPTIARLIDAPLPEHAIDGRSIVPLLLGEPGARSPHEALFFYYKRNHLEAMRSGRWKLHFPHAYRTMNGQKLGSGGRPGPYRQEKTGLELYDLEADIGETTDVSAQHADVMERLLALADTMRADLGDELTDVEATSARGPGRIADAPD